MRRTCTNPGGTASLHHHVHLTKEEIDEDRTAFAARVGAYLIGCLLPFTDRIENTLGNGGRHENRHGQEHRHQGHHRP